MFDQPSVYTELFTGSSDPNGKDEVVVVRVADFDREKLAVSKDKLTIRSIPVKDRGNRLLQNGDLLLEKSGGGDKTLVGSVVIFSHTIPALTSNFVGKMTPSQGMNSKFLTYIFSSLYSRNINYISIKQTTGIQNLDTESYLNEKFCIPVIETQEVIANFLDQKTAQIDQAVAIKEKQIALLKERKQILIQNAVTQGLNPNASMKGSGIDWIGQIPEYWDVKKLKYVVEIKKRIIGYEGPDVLSITQQGIKVKDITSGEGQISMDYSKYQIIQRGEFAMNHMDLLTGYVDISKFDGVISPDYRVFVNNSSGVMDEYLLLIFQLGYKGKIFYGYGQGVSQTGRWRFPADNFNNFKIMIPSIEEQRDIVEHIGVQSQKIDQAIALQQQQIDKLKEYKTTLINSTVTGKIKVEA